MRRCQKIKIFHESKHYGGHGEAFQQSATNTAKKILLQTKQKKGVPSPSQETVQELLPWTVENNIQFEEKLLFVNTVFRIKKVSYLSL